jgi:hypothetical protein
MKTKPSTAVDPVALLGRGLYPLEGKFRAASLKLEGAKAAADMAAERAASLSGMGEAYEAAKRTEMAALVEVGKVAAEMLEGPWSAYETRLRNREAAAIASNYDRPSPEEMRLQADESRLAASRADLGYEPPHGPNCACPFC